MIQPSDRKNHYAQQDTDAWSIYWQGKHLRSCLPSYDHGKLGQIDAIWEEFAKEISRDGQVIDLATGNGAVPAILLKQNRGIHVTAVDLAEISPPDFFAIEELSKRATFIGNTNIAKLPMENYSFDATTSQFGFEYSNTKRAIKEVHRILKPGGRFLFLIHHSESAIANTTVKKVAEIDHLLHETQFPEIINAFQGGEVPHREIEIFPTSVQKSIHCKSEEVTGQVLHAISSIYKLAISGDPAAPILAKTLTIRLNADHLRLKQMLDSAHSVIDFYNLVKDAKEVGFNIENAAPFMLSGEKPTIIGWLLSGAKK